jgi:hypothetical protein
MGFNIEEYEMYDNDSYSNGSGLFGGKLKEKLGIGSGSIKEKLGIGDGKVLGIVVNKSKNEEYKANKNIVSGNVDTTSVASNTKPLDVVEEAKVKADDKQKRDEIIAQSNALKEVTSLPLNTNIALTNTDSSEKSNTLLYASIGGAILILVVVGFVVFRGKTNN